ncbi:hypothetical protein D0817_22935 [Flavobacterium cupreum]|uniref:Uncharacterized protein n=1 Tax=Flavobacterium cupreum TaxID=2133766 RepID=A0A434A1E4_9FLAO|nr:hypothetical protein [Flavobacterium cupreum]RUT68181.1 hypothetical protein D0817_22935 [Flavobacterium cupreum]
MKKRNAKKEVQEKRKEIKKTKQTEKRPFMQVDKSGDVISNFLSNFLRQLKNPTRSGLGKLLGRLLFIRIKENQKEPQKPSNLIGPVKTVFRRVNNPEGAVESPSQNKSLSQHTSQYNNTAVKQSQDKEQEISKPRKTKLEM